MNKKEKNFIEKHFKTALHATFNPVGPGAVRIHLVPSNDQDKAPCLVIINGNDIIPINKSWSFILASFINNINKYQGKEISQEILDVVINETVKEIKALYFYVSKKRISDDLMLIIEVLCKIAYHQEISEEIRYLSIGEYAPFMNAPHRIDLMVSAMTKNGKWHCNQKCIHCYAAGQKCSDEKELDTDNWKKIIDKCREVGITQLTFTGGEPTMRNDLIELISHSKWFVTRLNTNGALLSKEYCQKLLESEVDNVQITFYSHDRDIHNHLVGAKNFDKTVEGIKHAIECGLPVSINTPLCTLNSDYVKTLEFLKNIGVEYVTCSGLIITGNAIEEASQKTQLTHDEILNTLTNAVKYCNENKIEISFTTPGWLKEEELKPLGLMIPSCGACLSNMAITPSGKVVPCQSWLSDEPLGDFLLDDWKTIWESAKCKTIRDESSQMLGTCPLRDCGGKNDEK